MTQAELAASAVETSGPEGNYGAILFIEKEGFTIENRFDEQAIVRRGTSHVTFATRQKVAMRYAMISGIGSKRHSSWRGSRWRRSGWPRTGRRRLDSPPTSVAPP